MAIEWVREAPIGRDATRDIDRSSLTREFLVKTDDPTDGAWAVRLATDVPRLYDPHPEVTAARARDINAAPEQNYKLLWRVRVNYATGVIAAPSENPLDRPKQRSWSFVATQELMPLAYDAAGNLNVHVRNSAHVPFVPAIEREAHLALLTITRNESNYNAALCLAYQDTVNSDIFYTAPPGTVKFFGGGATEVPDGAFTYWQATYQFLFKKDGHAIKVADMGVNERSAFGIHPIYHKDNTGHKTKDKITVPVYLDGAGVMLADGLDPVYLDFSPCKPVPYAPLNLE